MRRSIGSAVLGLLLVPCLITASSPAPAANVQVLFSFQDPAITESSGLTLVAGIVATINDSGDTGRVFSVDPTNGQTLTETHWEDSPVDVEALTRGPGNSVWVGDIGDNQAVRSSIKVALVPIRKTSKIVHPTVYTLVYPDGAHNAETLMRNPATDRLYVATKQTDGGTIYRLPSPLSATQPNPLTPVGSVLKTATDGTFFADGNHFIVRNYSEASIYAFPSMDLVSTFALPAQPQGEGLALDSQNRLVLSSEGVNSQVLRVALPPAALAAVSARPPTRSRQSALAHRPIG